MIDSTRFCMQKPLSVYHLQPSLAFLLLRALNKRGHTALKSTVCRMAHSWQGKAGVPRARWSPTSLLSTLSSAHICLSECQSLMNINAQRWQRWIVAAAERRISSSQIGAGPGTGIKGEGDAGSEVTNAGLKCIFRGPSMKCAKVFLFL